METAVAEDNTHQAATEAQTETIPDQVQQAQASQAPKKESSARKKKTFKIIVIGDTGVGKTCLTYRFCSGKFPTTPTDATIGVDFREKLITLDSNEQVSSILNSEWIPIYKSY